MEVSVSLPPFLPTGSFTVPDMVIDASFQVVMFGDLSFDVQASLDTALQAACRFLV